MWARLDDAILDNPKIIAAGPLATLLHIAAIVWSARHLTDGFIPSGKVATLVNWHGALLHIELEADVGEVMCTGRRIEGDDFVDILLTLQLWHEVQGGYQIHDFLEYNRSKKQVLAERARWASRQDKRRSEDEPPTESRVESTRSHACPVPVPVPGSVPKEENLSFATLTQGDATSPRPTELGFETFWKPYPKKRHKPAAARAWKAVDGARHLEAIVAGVERWKASEQWAGGRIEDPSTFLRQRQWEDAVPAPVASDSVEGMADRIRKKGLL